MSSVLLWVGQAGTAVPVLVWGMVPAKHVQQEEWMLRVWGEHRGVGREVVVWSMVVAVV